MHQPEGNSKPPFRAIKTDDPKSFAQLSPEEVFGLFHAGVVCYKRMRDWRTIAYVSIAGNAVMAVGWWIATLSRLSS